MNPYPNPDMRDSDSYDQARLELFRKFIRDLEELARTHSGNYLQGQGQLIEQIRHINVLKWHPGNEDYLTETWHRSSPNPHDSEDALMDFCSNNLFLAGLEPFVIYQEHEELDHFVGKEEKKWQKYNRQVRNFCYHFLKPWWLWSSLIWKDKHLSRWEGIKLSLAMYLLQNIYYRNR